MQRFHNAINKFTHRYCYCSTEYIVEALSVVTPCAQFLMKIFCIKRREININDGKYSVVLLLALGRAMQPFEWSWHRQDNIFDAYFNCIMLSQLIR